MKLVANPMRRRSVFILFFTAMLVAVVGPVRPAWARTTVNDVAQYLTCQCGCGLTVANCDNPHCEFAVPVKHQIAKMLAKGMNKDQILASFVHKYGIKILAEPPAHGFNLLAWVMPFLAILIGGGFIALVLGRWRRSSPSLPDGSGGGGEQTPAIDPKLREQLRQEVREQL